MGKTFNKDCTLFFEDLRHESNITEEMIKNFRDFPGKLECLINRVDINKEIFERIKFNFSTTNSIVETAETTELYGKEKKDENRVDTLFTHCKTLEDLFERAKLISKDQGERYEVILTKKDEENCQIARMHFNYNFLIDEVNVPNEF